jgi:hypothetical protein
LRTSFSVRDLWGETQLHPETIRDYVRGLEAAGYITKLSPEQQRGHTQLYEIAKDAHTAPRVRRDGTEVTQGQGNTLMWRTMKVLGTFDARELAVTASIEECRISTGAAKAYCHMLHKAGYLVVIKKGHGTGNGGKLAMYRLIPQRYTGPQAPQIQRIKQVWDPNTNTVVWSSNGGEHA